MASSSTDTEATFVALLKELGLHDYKQKFEDNGWMTLQDFAYAPADKDKFETETVPHILNLSSDADKDAPPTAPPALEQGLRRG